MAPSAEARAAARARQFGDAVDQSDRARSRPRALKSIGLLRSRMLICRKLAPSNVGSGSPRNVARSHWF